MVIEILSGKKLRFNLRVYFLLLILLSGSSVLADPGKYRVKTHPLSLLIIGPNGEIEVFTGNKFSVSPAFYIVNFGPDDEKIRGFDIGLNANYYFTNAHKNSFLLSPSIHFFRIIENTTPEFEDNIQNHVLEPQDIIFAGISVGYQIVWQKSYSAVFELGFYAIAKHKDLTGQMYSPIMPTFTLGYEFDNF